MLFYMTFKSIIFIHMYYQNKCKLFNYDTWKTGKLPKNSVLQQYFDLIKKSRKYQIWKDQVNWTKNKGRRASAQKGSTPEVVRPVQLRNWKDCVAGAWKGRSTR